MNTGDKTRADAAGTNGGLYAHCDWHFAEAKHGAMHAMSLSPQGPASSGIAIELSLQGAGAKAATGVCNTTSMARMPKMAMNVRITKTDHRNTDPSQ